MASLAFAEDDVLCPVCCDIFTDPVLLSCSHSFCKACLREFWKRRAVKDCPTCREYSTGEPPCNRALKNLCEAFKNKKIQGPSAGSEVLCSLHGEKLKLFCQDDQEPMCLVCQMSLRHRNHMCCTIKEAACHYKEEIQKALDNRNERLKILKEVNENFDQTEKHIKVQTQNTEKKIQDQFEMIHQFLKGEEAARIVVLREEGEQKSQMIKAKIYEVRKEISTLSDTIRVIEEKMKAEDVSFLLNYKTTAERVQCTMGSFPQLVSGALIDVAKHLRNLTFEVWNKMKDIVFYTPVILDPNTANPGLILSDDLTSLRCGEIQQLPDNPERFDKLAHVLGSEGFNSGIHSWDIEVGKGRYWELGMMSESVQNQKKGIIEDGYWMIWCLDGDYKAGDYMAGVPPQAIDLTVSQKPQRIRVQLDWEGGQLTFTDCDGNKHLHTFRYKFTERLFPVFCSTCPHYPMRILPVKVK